MIITIDGPVASGKSTIARLLAANLDIYYINSGSIYRACAYILLQKYMYTISQLKQPSFITIVDHIITSGDLVYIHDSLTQEQIYYQHQNITTYLKSADVDAGASIISAIPAIRIYINNFLRNISKDYSIVIDGRDTGSVIFPHATHKFYITASLDVRVNRWKEAQKQLGNILSFETASQLIQERDLRDSTRQADPLCVPDNAIIIDSSHYSQQELLQHLQDYITTLT